MARTRPAVLGRRGTTAFATLVVLGSLTAGPAAVATTDPEPEPIPTPTLPIEIPAEGDPEANAGRPVDLDAVANLAQPRKITR